MRQLFLKVLVYTLGSGTGLIVLAALLAWPVRWYVNRPLSWTKLTGELVMANKAKDNWEAVPKPPKGFVPEDGGGFDFSFVVTNNTREEFQLTSNAVRLYMVNTQSQALVEEPSATIQFPSNGTEKDLPILFPPWQRVQMTIHLAQSLDGNDAGPLYRKTGESLSEAMPRVVGFLHERAPTFGGFAILDNQNRYEIDLPFSMR
jgi:hypothetical protein